MRKQTLYDRLEKDFIKPEITDVWFAYMAGSEPYVCANFRERSMGLVCDFTDEIRKVYTAVFPSDAVLGKILASEAEQAMLFVHHPCVWDLSVPGGFRLMDDNLLERLWERRIAVYCLHHPLDHYGSYSTSKTLADALGLEVERPFAEVCGAVCGVIGTTDCSLTADLQTRFTRVVGHETRLYSYGPSEIEERRVALCAGGGNQEWVLQEALEQGVHVFVTGITVKNEFSAKAHGFAEAHGITLLGGSHYSTEKFACRAMCDYFREVGIQSEFVAEMPCLEDM